MFLVDIGNSFIKSAFVHKGEVTFCPPVATRDFAGKAVTGWPFVAQTEKTPDLVYVSSVVDKEITQNCRELIMQKWGLEPEFASVSNNYMGLTTQYEDPGALGVDRWLACLAAWRDLRNDVVVVDAGTAITIDFVSAKGEHLGGVIGPGIGTMMAALEKNTTRLKQADREIGSFTVPRDSEQALLTGAVFSALGLLREMKLQCRYILGVSEPVWLFNGGAVDQLSNGISWPHIRRKNLVIEGLKLLAAG